MQRKHFLVHCLIYTLVHFPLLLNSGIYWDDWTIIHNTSEGIRQQFVDNGVTIAYYMHWFFVKFFDSSWPYHVLTFLFYFLSYTCIYRLLVSKRVNMHATAAMALLLLLDVLPFNENKITVICFWYTLSHVFFWTGLYLSESGYKDWKKYIGYLFLVLSFVTPSIMFYYLVILAMLVFLDKRDAIFAYWQKRKIGKILSEYILTLIKKYGIHVVVACSFFVFYKMAFKANQANMANYNSFSMEHLLSMPWQMVKVTYINGIEFWHYLISIPGHHMALFTIFAVWMWAVVFLKDDKWELNKIFSPLLVAGIILWCAALFPYLSVGKLPTFYENLTRHHLLTPLGFALMMAAIIFLFKDTRIRRIGLTLMLAYFGSMTMRQYLNFTAEDMRQSAILQELPKVRQAFERRTFIMEDRTKEFRSNEDPNRIYVNSGLMKLAFGDSKRFWGDTIDLNYIATGERNYYVRVGYNLKDDQYTGKIDCVVQLVDKKKATDMFLLTNLLSSDAAFKEASRDVVGLYFVCR